jgi:bla regulator protein BlaR1
MNSQLTKIIDAIGWALLSSLWQLSAIALLLFVILHLFARSKPRIIYAVSYLALVLCVLIPLASFFQSLQTPIIEVHGQMATSVTISTMEKNSSEFNLQSFFALYLQEIVLAWFAIVCLLSLRLIMGFAWLQWITQSQHPHQAQLQILIDRLVGRFDLKFGVSVRVVADLTGPITMGVIKPMILVPAAMMSRIDVQLVEALIAHELAHIKRFDYAFNLIQNLVEIILFYHPAVWWISKQIRRERENIADDIAANVLGEPRRLALALQELELFQFSQTQIALGANGGDLMSRITRLIRPQNQSLGWKAIITFATVVGTSLALAANAMNVQMKEEPIQQVNRGELVERADMHAEPATQVQLPEAMSDEKRDPLHKLAVDTSEGEPPRISKHSEDSGARLESDVKGTKSSEEKVADQVKSSSSKSSELTGKVFEFKSPRVDLSNPNCSPSLPATTIEIVPSGLTMVKALVAEDGNIVRVSTVKSSGFVEFDEAVKHALMNGRCKATPGKVNGQSFAAEASLSVDWSEVGRRPATPPETVTFAAEKSSTRPAIVQLGAAECQLEYPKASRRNLEEGITEAQLSIGADGQISNVTILKSSGFRGLDKALQATLQSGSCKASPSVINGIPVASTIELAHVWKLSQAN